MNNNINDMNDLDNIVNWINDDSKVLTKKQKNKLKDTCNTKKEKKSKVSKEIKDKLNKYSRDSNPFYKKTLAERIQIQKQYKNMLKEEELFKDNKMKDIMERMKNMTQQDQQNYLNELLSNKEIEL